MDLKCLILLATVTLAYSEVIDFKKCAISNCDIHEVRVNPCPEASTHAACNIKRRKPASMSFDFTPEFDADSLEASLNWVRDANEELPLITMDKDACKYTQCPVKNGIKQTYTVDIPIENKFPLSSYTIKWNFKAPNGQQCCFTHDIKLVR